MKCNVNEILGYSSVGIVVIASFLTSFPTNYPVGINFANVLTLKIEQQNDRDWTKSR